MSYKTKQSEIEKSLEFLKVMFNPNETPSGPCAFQFTFKEKEGPIDIHISTGDGQCELSPGIAQKPKWWVVTDIETWNRLAGEYTTGLAAMLSGRLSFKKGMFFFLARFHKIFGGKTDWPLSKDTYLHPPGPKKIENVLVLSCSNRGKQGATQLVADHLIAGMERAGATVTTLFPSEMDIHHCCGRFHCWQNREKGCVYKKDGMKTVFEAYEDADLVIWATPIYFFHCSSIMKMVMDRVFAFVDNRIVVFDNKETHPAKTDKSPHYALLAVSGFSDTEVFEPIKQTFRILSERRNKPMLAELIRPAAMDYFVKEPKLKSKDDALSALQKAGEELIRFQRVSEKTSQRVQQPILPLPMQVSAGNYFFDKSIETGNFIFKRAIEE